MSDVAMAHDDRRSVLGRRPAGLNGAEAAGVVALTALYYAGAKVGYVVGFTGPVAGIVWLPVGIAVAFLYLGGLALWPGVVLGDLLANDYGTLPLVTALAQTAGNVLEVLVATVLLRRLVRSGSPLETLGGVGRMSLALAAGTLVSAVVGTTAQCLSGVIGADEVAQVWRTWWLADLCGALVVVPLVLAWRHTPPRALLRGRELEWALVPLTGGALSALALASDRPLAYVVFPALIWAAVRLGPRGGTLVIAVVVAATVWSTTHYEGSFAFRDITHAIVSAQLFMAVAAFSTLLLAAAVAEREALARQLGQSHARLLLAVEAERRRIERNVHDGAQQGLAALALRLRLAADRAHREPEQAVLLLGQAEQDLQHSVDELRQLAHGIHPAVLTDLGLAKAITTLAARSPVPVRLGGLPSQRHAELVEATAYYLVAEALTNVHRHAQATSVLLCVSEAGGALHVHLSDDGVGGAVEGVGSGLQGLRFRLAEVGGTLAVESPCGGGTRLTAVIPT